MTTSTASSRNIVSKEIASPYMPVGTYTPWQRPSDWLTLPSLSSTVKFVGLIAVYDDENNYVAIGSVASTGSYTIDWGDGTSDTTSGAVTKQHKYTYSSLSSGTLTTRGYRQAIVTITVNTGTFDGINLTFAYSQTPTLPQYNTNWLDVNVGSATLGTILIGGGSAVSLNMLENINVDNCVSLPNSNFQSLLALQQITISSNFVPVTSTLSNFFLGCSSLIAAPVINTSSATVMSNMFQNCTSLQYVPPYDTSNVTTMNSMFAGCTTLKSVPQFNTAKVTNMGLMFQGCSSLPSIPYFNTSNVTTLTNFADSCYNLTTAPMLDTTKVTTTYFMFNNCYELTKIPSYNLSNCVTTTSMFANCTSLPTIPVFDTSKVTNTSGMFQGCFKLSDLPNLNYSNVTNTTFMFSNCTSLVDLSSLSTPNITIGPTNMFSGCTNLVSLPANLPYSAVNTGTVASMFANNNKLRGNININIGLSSTLVSSFTQCQDLTSVTITGNSLTSIATGFNNCRNIRNINFSNLSAITTTTSAFNTCVNLTTLRVPNLGVSFSVSPSMLSKQALETMFDDLRNNTTVQTATITNCQGADPIQTKSGSGITANSNVITMSSTTGITTGMYVYGTGIQSGIPVTFTDVGDKVQYTNALTNTPIVNNDRVMFTAIVTTTGIVTNTTYYVVNATSTGFQVSATLGGSALPLTTNGTGTMTIGAPTGTSLPTIITAVNPGNVIITGVSGLTNAAATLTVRSLNTTVASVKNWTVTG